MLKMKGEKSIATMVTIVGAVMFLVIAAEAVTNIYTDAIRPGTDNIGDILDQTGRPTVQIGNENTGDGDIQPEKEFRALTTFNMMSAANCGVSALAVNAQKQEEPEFNEDYNLNPGPLQIFPEFEPLLTNTDFKGYCRGAEALDFNPVNGYTTPFNADNQKFNDVEGRQGKIFIEINESFTINDEKLAYINEVSGIPQDSDPLDQVIKGTTPDFFNGDRVAAFVPAGITHAETGDPNKGNAIEFYDDDTANYMDSKSGFNTGWMDTNREMYYYRVRMEDVLTIIDSGSEFRDTDDYTYDEFEKFVETAKYHFCSGSRGILQSNAGAKAENYPEYDEDDIIGDGSEGELRGHEAGNDEKGGSNAQIEDGVFPRVELTDPGNCLNESSEESDEEWKFYGLEAGSSNEVCSFSDAMNFEPNPDESTLKEINGDGNRQVQCGLRRDSTDFSGFNGEVDFYEAGWFGKCSEFSPETEELRDNFDQARGTVLTAEEAEGNYPTLKYRTGSGNLGKHAIGHWDISEVSGRERIHLTTVYNKSPHDRLLSPGKVDLFNGTEESENKFVTVNFRKTSTIISQPGFNNNVAFDNLAEADLAYRLEFIIPPPGSDNSELEVRITSLEDSSLSRSTTIDLEDGTLSSIDELSLRLRDGGNNDRVLRDGDTRMNTLKIESLEVDKRGIEGC